MGIWLQPLVPQSGTVMQAYFQGSGSEDSPVYLRLHANNFCQEKDKKCKFELISSIARCKMAQLHRLLPEQ
jgi:hypothetical protein